MKLGSLAIVILAGMLSELSSAAPLNLYEWSAVAPIVAAGDVVAEEGRYKELKVARVLRGDVEPSSILRIDLRRANRTRSLNAGLKALRLEQGKRYLVLLERAPVKKAHQPAYRLVRGVRGARELRAEGAAATLDALQRFVEIQDEHSDTLAWSRFSGMLEETNPVLLETALDQFLKFRRGSPGLVLSLRPLLDHPRPDLRERAARLLGQIVRHHLPPSIQDPEDLRTELIGIARRDEVVEVRVAATDALSAFDDSGVEEVLTEIADSDPEQLVRYTAQKLLLERRSRTTESPR